MHGDIILVFGSSQEGQVTAWYGVQTFILWWLRCDLSIRLHEIIMMYVCRDLETGTSLCSFKGNSSPARAACPLGRDYFVSCQLKKPLLHFWDWRKENVIQKSFIPEKCSSIACSLDGSLCAAGGESGTIHLWDTSVGRLLVSWKAHHKRISSIAFRDTSTEIVVGSDDSLVTVWSLSRVMHSLAQPHDSSLLQPLHTWSDHTMPISDLAIGSGVADPYVYICSLDHRVSVRSLVSGRLMAVVTLPSALTALALDPLEYYAYVGSSTGSTYKVSFVDNSPIDPTAHVIQEYKTASNGLVTSLAVSKTGDSLVIGTEDGSVMVWDTVTGQQIRKSSAGSAVSTVLVIGYPLGMAGRGRGRAPESSFRMRPLANFSKVIGSSGIQPGIQPWQTSLVLLDSHQPGDGSEELDTLLGFKHSSHDVSTINQGLSRGEASEALQERVSQLEKDNALLTEQKNRAVSLLNTSKR